MKKCLVLILTLLALSLIAPKDRVEAKSYIRSYTRSSGTSVRSYIRYKADGYGFNNYMYRPDRGYRK